MPGGVLPAIGSSTGWRCRTACLREADARISRGFGCAGGRRSSQALAFAHAAAVGHRAVFYAFCARVFDVMEARGVQTLSNRKC
jgi:hypothetical protein